MQTRCHSYVLLRPLASLLYVLIKRVMTKTDHAENKSPLLCGENRYYFCLLSWNFGNDEAYLGRVEGIADPLCWLASMAMVRCVYLFLSGKPAEWKCYCLWYWETGCGRNQTDQNKKYCFCHEM